MSRKLRLAAVYVALFAMITRALLPTGWMPNIGGGLNGSPFTICTMDGPVHASSGQQQKQTPQPDDARHHDICPFAWAPHFAAPVDLQGSAALSTVSTIYLRSFATGLLTERDPYAPQSLRGPPSFA